MLGNAFTVHEYVFALEVVQADPVAVLYVLKAKLVCPVVSKLLFAV
jgi:hypothetical protein